MAGLSNAPFDSPYTSNNIGAYELDDSKENQDYDYSVQVKLRKSSQNTAISSVPPSLKDEIPQSIHREKRPPFRSPSSIRALQLSERESACSPRDLRQEAKRQKWSLGAVRDLDTFDSDGDDNTTDNAFDGDSAVLQHLMTQKRQARNVRRREATQCRVTSTSTIDTMQQQAPLVLLHITVLPNTVRYSRANIEKVAPQYVQDNLDILRDKLNDNVFARGILVPHPGEDYDVLEERLLEALELCVPRVSPCGHFLGNEDDSFSHDGPPPHVNTAEGTSLRASPAMQAICDYAHSENSRSSIETRSNVCDTCSAPMRDPFRGVGNGNRRWEINFYAANGLMRTGAWFAAWREMERVDVEISPWMPPEVKRALDREARAEEEVAFQRREEDELKSNVLRNDMVIATNRIHALENDLVRLHDQLEATKAITASRRREFTQSGSSQAENHHYSGQNADMLDLPTIPGSKLPSYDVPLDRLLMRYILLLAQDKRNIALAVLTILFSLLAIYMAPFSTYSRSQGVATIDTAPVTKIDATSLSAMVSGPINATSTMTATPILSSVSSMLSNTQTPAPLRRSWF